MIQVRNALNQIAERMAEDNSNQTLLWESTEVVVFRVYPSHKLGIPEVLDVRLRDPKRNLHLRNPEKAYAFKKKILIIDDINDTGETFLFIKKQFWWRR